jgi:lipid-A-disaccharide synthase-like uncharacterized protein
MDFIFKIIGIIGVLLICLGIVKRGRKVQDYLYILGGVMLACYSIYIKDIIFIILQLVFTATAIYDYGKIEKHYKKKNSKATKK